MSARKALTCTFLLVLPTYLFPAPSRAQDSNVVFGLGIHAIGNTDDGMGIGLRGRISTPVSADLSFAADLGFASHFLDGRDESVFSFDPQISAIITMPGESSALYFMAGTGGYLSTGGTNGNHNGPSLHIGIGGVKPLSDSALFYEINPAVIIKKSSLSLSVPIRVGIIL
jgi:hypothetical protein